MAAVRHDYAVRTHLTLRDRRALADAHKPLSAAEHQRRMLKTEYWGGWILGYIAGALSGVLCMGFLLLWIEKGSP